VAFSFFSSASSNDITSNDEFAYLGKIYHSVGGMSNKFLPIMYEMVDGRKRFKRGGEGMTKTGIIALFMSVLYSFVLGFVCYQIGAFNARSAVVDVDSATVQMDKIVRAADRDIVLPTREPLEIVYIIREHNSRIGVYENNELIRIVDVKISSLGAQDARMLREGIEVRTLEEVAEILEDYTS
jgi:hypothetical protein